jgi:hypothetical protein
VVNSWSGGFQGEVRIKNDSTTAINGWTVNWAYAAGSKVTGFWNATITGTGPYTATNLSHNASIPAGQTVSFGFQGTQTGTTNEVPKVTGTLCKP